MTPGRALVILKALRRRFPGINAPDGLVPASLLVEFLRTEIASPELSDSKARNYEMIQLRREGWTLAKLSDKYDLAQSTVEFITRCVTNERNAAKFGIVQFAVENPNLNARDLAKKYKMPLSKIKRILAGAAKIATRTEK